MEVIWEPVRIFFASQVQGNMLLVSTRSRPAAQAYKSTSHKQNRLKQQYVPELVSVDIHMLLAHEHNVHIHVPNFLERRALET
jgi:hypothetical protein